MTSNGIMAIIFAFFSPNSIALQADYVTVVEGRPIMSILSLGSSLSLLAKTNAPCSAVSAIAEHLVYNSCK